MADIVRAGTLWGYPALVQSLGGDAEPIMDAIGLSGADLDNPDRFILRRAAEDLLDRTADELACSDFGLRLAQIQDVFVLGALAFAIRNAADLKSAVSTAARHLHTHATSASLTLERTGAGSRRIVLQAGLESSRSGAQAHEHTMALMCRIIRLLTDGTVRPTGVQFRHAPISAYRVYRAHLDLEPSFNTDADAALFRAQDLDAPLKSASTELQAIVERYLETHSPYDGDLLDQQVRHVLMRLMRESSAGVDDVAEVLRMHPRTLQRKLAAMNTSFGQVRDEVRRSLAEVYLAHDVIPISHVAELLGYSDQSVLARSCMRWFGKTPLAIRRDRSAERRAEA